MIRELPKKFLSQKDKRYQYDLINFIGQGSGGLVYLANQTDLTNNYTMKVAIKNKVVSLSEDEYKLTEELIINRLKYPNIVQYYDIFELKNFGFILVMEYMESGNLYDYICDISNKKKEHFVKEAQQIIFQISKGIQQLHSNGLMHRDLKPENVLIQLKSDNIFVIKICDMDLVKKVKQEDLYNTQCVGTAYYIAPEVLEEQTNNNGLVQYDSRCDVWALGAIIYEIFSGLTLFQGSQQQIQDAILGFNKNKNYYYQQIDELKYFDQGYKKIIKSMLTYDYTQRPSIDDVIIQMTNYGSNHILQSIDEDKYQSRKINNQGKDYYCLDPQQSKSNINGFRVYTGRQDDPQNGQQILIYVYSHLDEKGISQIEQLIAVKDKLKYIMPINDYFQYQGDWVIIQHINKVEEIFTMDQQLFPDITKQQQIKNLICCLQELSDYKLVVGDFKLSYMVKYSSENFKLDVMKSDYFFKEKLLSRNDPDWRFHSPEFKDNNKTSQKSDIWTMGVLIYEIVCGKQLVISNFEQAIIDKQVNEVDIEYRAYLQQMLKIKPELRCIPTTSKSLLLTTTTNKINQKLGTKQPQQAEQSQDEIVQVLKRYDDPNILFNLFMKECN